MEGVEKLTMILCCKISSLPLHYLGITLGSPYKAMSIWDSSLDCMMEEAIFVKRERGLLLLRVLSSIHVFLIPVCSPLKDGRLRI